MRFGTSQGLFADILMRHGLDNIRTGDEHKASFVDMQMKSVSADCTQLRQLYSPKIADN